MATPIDRIRAKVTRAKRHIADCQVAFEAFYNAKPYSVRFREDAQAAKRIYYVADVKEVTLDVEVIAADALGNLREALDHIAFQLESSSTGSEPGYVYYPIANDASEYSRLRDKYMKQANQSAKDAIDATEPYKGGKGHGLWQLNKLKISDKHRMLVMAHSILMGVDLSPTVTQLLRSRAPEWVRNIPVPSVFVREVGAAPLKVGDALFIEPVDHEIEEERQFAFEIAFHMPGVVEDESALKTLQRIAALVDDLVMRFSPLLS